ncbi:unnamed protein product [Diamesa serratosioi]
MSKVVANIVSDYFDNSSIHGLKYLKEGNCFVGVFWLTSLILSTCGCSYLINKTYDKWDKSPVILTFDEKLISTSTIPFPAVTICPEIKFKRELFNISAIGWTVKQSEEQIRIENALHSICPYIQTHTSTIYESFENMTGELKRIAIPIANIVSDYFDNSTIHGLKYLKEGNCFVGVFWLTSLILSTFGCSYLIIKTYDKWDKSPVILTFDEKPISTSTIPFPALTICPKMKFKPYKINASYSKVKQSEEQIRLQNGMHPFCPYMPLSVNESHENMTDDLKKIAIPFNDIFTSCVYQGISIDCRYLFFEVRTDEGICYSFNMLNHNDILNDIIDDSLKYPKHNNYAVNWTLQEGYTDISSKIYPERVVGSGLSRGLDIWLQMYKTNMEYGCNVLSQGFRLSLHSPTDIPRFSKDYYPIPLGKLVQFSIDPEVIKTSDGLKNYKPGIRQCDGEKSLKFFKVYTQSNCELECLSNYTQKSCNCVKLGHPHETGTKMCTRRAEACYNEAEANWMSEILNQKANGSQPRFNECKCLPSCTSLEYTAEISQSDFFHEQYFQAVNVLVQENIMMSKISIYLKKNQFIALKRTELFGLTDFLSNCGGLLSVFMGFSILSIVEFVYHIFLRWMCFKKGNSICSKDDIEQAANNTPDTSIHDINNDEVNIPATTIQGINNDEGDKEVDDMWYIEIESL